MAYWLFKSEPNTYGIDHLIAEPNQTTIWDGIRNYQARNFIRDQVAIGDQVFFYHSSCKDIGIAGVAQVVSAAYPDPSQFDPESRYFDIKATEQTPRWFSVDVKFVKKFNKVISLARLKQNSKIVELPLVNKGHRLSIMPVTSAEWREISEMQNDS